MTHAQLSDSPVPGATEAYHFEQLGLGPTTVLAVGGDGTRRRADALERAAKVINSTTLPPDEDPALLPGPDRGDVHRVVDHIRKAPS
jgi:hypothetical protein